tara:strand:+ start:469 stop:768 length:300 start_codon:yes stop_codon:yes gene_type:complete
MNCPSSDKHAQGPGPNGVFGALLLQFISDVRALEPRAVTDAGLSVVPGSALDDDVKHVWHKYLRLIRMKAGETPLGQLSGLSQLALMGAYADAFAGHLQ